MQTIITFILEMLVLIMLIFQAITTALPVTLENKLPIFVKPLRHNGLIIAAKNKGKHEVMDKTFIGKRLTSKLLLSPFKDIADDEDYYKNYNNYYANEVKGEKVIFERYPFFILSDDGRDPFEALKRNERVVKESITTSAQPSQEDSFKKASQQTGYRITRRNWPGDTSKIHYFNPKERSPAPITDMHTMFLMYSLPVAICWIVLAVFCIFGLRPDGALCNKIFSKNFDPLTRTV